MALLNRQATIEKRIYDAPAACINFTITKVTYIKMTFNWTEKRIMPEEIIIAIIY